MAVEMVCKITPRQKTTIVTINPYLRPKKSAVGAAVRAPKKVPAERIETIIDDCEDVIAGRPSTV